MLNQEQRQAHPIIFLKEPWSTNQFVVSCATKLPLCWLLGRGGDTGAGSPCQHKVCRSPRNTANSLNDGACHHTPNLALTYPKYQMLTRQVHKWTMIFRNHHEKLSNWATVNDLCYGNISRCLMSPRPWCDRHHSHWFTFAGLSLQQRVHSLSPDPTYSSNWAEPCTLSSPAEVHVFVQRHKALSKWSLVQIQGPTSNTSW